MSLCRILLLFACCRRHLSQDNARSNIRRDPDLQSRCAFLQAYSNMQGWGRRASLFPWLCSISCCSRTHSIARCVLLSTYTELLCIHSAPCLSLLKDTACLLFFIRHWSVSDLSYPSSSLLSPCLFRYLALFYMTHYCIIINKEEKSRGECEISFLLSPPPMTFSSSFLLLLLVLASVSPLPYHHFSLLPLFYYHISFPRKPEAAHSHR